MHHNDQFLRLFTAFDNITNDIELFDTLKYGVKSLSDIDICCNIAQCNTSYASYSNAVINLRKDESEIIFNMLSDDNPYWITIPNEKVNYIIKSGFQDDSSALYTIFPICRQSTSEILLICRHFLEMTDATAQHIAVLCRYANACRSRLETSYRNEKWSSAMKNFCRSIASMGPQARVSDIMSKVINEAVDILETDYVTLFSIDPRSGNIKCLSSHSTPIEVTDEFERSFDTIITDKKLDRAVIYDIASLSESDSSSSDQIFMRNQVQSIFASPIRSEVGVIGALVAFYKHSIDEPELMYKVIESVADIATIAVSFAFSVEQSHFLLDDLAGTNLELFIQASEDALTGLANHRLLQQSLSELCKSNGNFSLIMADVDHFKQYNDTYGHLEGDEVLRRVADILSREVRQVDIVARYGGEEFAIILRGAHKEIAFATAERIREAIAENKCGMCQIALSMGISEYPKDATTPSDLVFKADSALYESKRNGRNKTTLWSGEKQTI